MPLGLGNFISSSWAVVRGAKAYSLCLCRPHWRDIFHNQKTGGLGMASTRPSASCGYNLPCESVIAFSKAEMKAGLVWHWSAKLWHRMTWSFVPALTSFWQHLRLSRDLRQPKGQAWWVMATRDASSVPTLAALANSSWFSNFGKI